MREEEKEIFARSYDEKLDEEFGQNVCISSSKSTDSNLCCNHLLTEFIPDNKRPS